MGTYVALGMADRLSENDGIVEFLGSSHSELESDGEVARTRFSKIKRNGASSNNNTEKV